MRKLRVIPTVPQEDREKLNEGSDEICLTSSEFLEKINKISNKILKGNGNTIDEILKKCEIIDSHEIVKIIKNEY